MQIFLSIGHGGESGAIANNTTEHQEAKKQTLEAITILRNNGLDVIRVPDYGLTSRCTWIRERAKNTDFALEIHLNSASPQATGAEIYYYDGDKDKLQQADQLIELYSNDVGLNNRGAKPDSATRHGRLGFVRDTRCNAYLLEACFITNTTDLAKFRANGAQAIANTLLTFFGKNNVDQTIPDWAKSGYDYVVQNEISDGTRPNDMMTRAEMWTMLERQDKIYRDQITKLDEQVRALTYKLTK